MENNQPDEGSHNETYFRLNIHDIGYYHPGKNLVPAARFETCELVFRGMTAGVRALRDEGCKYFPNLNALNYFGTKTYLMQNYSITKSKLNFKFF